MLARSTDSINIKTSTVRLIYDYFTDNVSGEHSDEEVKEAITSAIWSL